MMPMPATEPPHVTDEIRPGERSPDPMATHAKGSYRTLVQMFDGENWVTRHEYPGDWAWQWEKVAQTERHRVSQNINAAREAVAILNRIY